VSPPIVRVGILVDVARISIGADAGVVVHVSGSPAKPLSRATFLPAPQAGRLVLLETGEEVEVATIVPAVAASPLYADAAPFRGLLEVRAGAGALTVVNIVNLDDYLKGVVPNELSPEAYPQIEALKAQAVAARTYALAHLGEYATRGFDVCATAACQVYRGRSSEHPLTDRAVEETRDLLATWQGRPINAYYTSTCGGHTEDAGNVFDGDTPPYLRGVACLPERSARHTVHTAAPRRRHRRGDPGLARETALLHALGITEDPAPAAAWLRAEPSQAELRGWTGRLLAAVRTDPCESPAKGPLARRGTLALHLVASLCWQERAERLLAPGDEEYLLQAEDEERLADATERRAMALLVQEGLLSPWPDNTLRPEARLTRAEALALIAGAAEKAGPAALERGELGGLADGLLTVVREGSPSSHPIDPAVRLFRNLDGLSVAASELTLSVGDRIGFVRRGERVVFLESEETRQGAAADRESRYYRWERRLTPEEVARSLERYGSVGAVRDLVPKRIGVSGRVVELVVRGSSGDLVLSGLRIRWGLGLRESLFVIGRERDERGRPQGFVFTGKGWGHGVGLCQVGAAGMARAGSTFDEILRHYYHGIELQPRES
jgi:stage II sporulation protein D